MTNRSISTLALLPAGLAMMVAGCAASSGVAAGMPVTEAPSASLVAQPAAQDQVVPTAYDEDRFFARPVVAATGETLNIYLDTGGNNVLYADVVARLGLAPVVVGEGKQARTEVLFPELSATPTMPRPHMREGRVIVFERGVADPQWSGLLGPEWFGQRCWLFDYPGQRLTMLGQCEASPDSSSASLHEVELGFAQGLYFPRVQATIDGQTLELLFDTGAHTRLTPQAQAALSDGHAATRATSFIADEVFRRWHATHPQWRVLEQAEVGTGEAMIEVPDVTIAGYTVGPVWFTRRADPNFHEYMSQWMDRRIDGALGGNALREFRVTLDYPHGRARFERPE